MAHTIKLLGRLTKGFRLKQMSGAGGGEAHLLRLQGVNSWHMARDEDEHRGRVRSDT